MSLLLKLLGDFELHDGAGAALSLPTRKSRALLAYLALNADRPQPRERLMALLWSDRGERQARQSLNQALLSIRKLAENAGVLLLDSDGERVTLVNEAVDCDVQRLRALAKDDPVEASALYDGPFLDGLSAPDPAFEEWLLMTRTELHELACDALEMAAKTSGDITSAISCAKRLVTLDPLREDGHRQLMLLLHQSGDRASALRQFHACAEILKRELQVEPDASTKTLFEAIRQDTSTPAKGEMLSNMLENLKVGAAIRPSWLPKRSWFIAAVAAALLFVISAGVIAWVVLWAEPTELASRENASLPLPDKPSIAVLPFANLSGDPKEEYFSDGITEDIITRLARWPDMFVIARTSSFIYKDKAVKVQQIGRELGVRDILEGSVQKSADRIRITAQLIEAATGKHLWAKQYDRTLQQIFAVQDEIARKVAIEMAVKLTRGEMARSNFQSTKNIEAYHYLLRGVEIYRSGRKGYDVQAARFFKKAIELDPHYARAIARLGWVQLSYVKNLRSKNAEKSLTKAEELARRAISIDSNSAFGHLVLSRAHVFRHQYDEAMAEGRRAIEIEPNNAILHGMYARTSVFAGRLKEARALIKRALRLAPFPPVSMLAVNALIQYRSGHYQEAIAVCHKHLARSGKSKGLFQKFCYRTIIASHMALGREAEARAEARAYIEQDPAFSLKRRIKILKSRPDKDPSWIDRHVDLLRRAGLPD